jgi:hypothetical protein
MQKNMTTLGDVSNRVDTMSKNCWDKMIDVKDISFENLDRVRIGSEPHVLRPIAQRSISNRLGIPYQYLKKCPSELQARNLNHWIEKEKNDELFFRWDGEDVRAIFTPKYKPTDNFEVLERLDSLGYSPETKVQCHLDDQFMSLSIPDGKKTFDVKGDRITPGISVSNSEVGLASLSISCFFLRIVCVNGMISKTEIGASYRHVSYKILEEFPQVLEKVSMELGAQRSKFLLSTESKVDDPHATMLSFNRQFQMGKEEQEAVEWAWPQEMGDTMFNIIQAYTRAAQYEGLSAESSYRLMKVGGNILGMLN